jgi:hypothetical protein
LQLLFVWSLACCLIFFFYLSLSLNGCIIPAISYTQLAVGFLFFEHIFTLVLILCLNFTICGLRLWLRTPTEFLI